MARRRAAPRPASGAVPPELLDLDAPPWRTAAAAIAWCEDHDVPAPGVLAVLRSPAARLRVVIPAFTTASGHSDPRWPNFPDSVWLRETGLEAVKQRCTRLVLVDLTRKATAPPRA